MADIYGLLAGIPSFPNCILFMHESDFSELHFLGIIVRQNGVEDFCPFLGEIYSCMMQHESIFGFTRLKMNRHEIHSVEFEFN